MELTEKQKLAENYIVNEKRSKNETYKLVGISKPTIIAWAKKFGWPSNVDEAAELQEATKKFKSYLEHAQQEPYKFNTTGSKALELKRAQARYMAIIKGYSHKEISKWIGISTVTLSKWAKKYKWYEDDNINDPELYGGISSILEVFFKYAEDNGIAKHADLKKVWAKYCIEISSRI